MLNIFANCSALQSIIIPDGVTSIGADAFCYCFSLADIYCYAEQVPETASNAFNISNYTEAIRSTRYRIQQSMKR